MSDTRDPIHGPGCTMLDGKCVGWHCPKCGYPCSSQGHTLGCPDPSANHLPWLIAPPVSGGDEGNTP